MPRNPRAGPKIPQPARVPVAPHTLDIATPARTGRTSRCAGPTSAQNAPDGSLLHLPTSAQWLPASSRAKPIGPPCDCQGMTPRKRAAGVEGASGLDLRAFLTSNTRVRALRAVAIALALARRRLGARIIKVRDVLL